MRGIGELEMLDQGDRHVVDFEPHRRLGVHVEGVRKGGACVKARKRPPKAKRCTRYAKVRSLTHADVAGANRFRLKDRKLKPGAYRLRAVPRNSAGAGKAVTKRFRVKRR